MRHPDSKDWILLALLVALWGSAFALISVSLSGYTPWQVVTSRLWVGAIVLFILMRGRRHTVPTGAGTWTFFVVMAILGNTLPFFLISWGQQEVSSGVTGILMAIMPLIVLLLAHFFVPGERMTLLRLVGFVLGFVGIVILTGPDAIGQIRGRGTVFWSQFSILCGAACYAVNLIVARRAPRLDPLVTAAWVLLISAVLATVALFIDGDIAPARFSATPTIALLALGVMSTGLATVLYFRIVARAGATFLSLINYLIPVFAVVVGALFLNESLPLSSLLALGIILAGVVVSQRVKSDAGVSR